MLKLAKRYTWLTALAAVFAAVMLLGSVVVPVHAQPPPIPCAFYGYAYINGEQAANGKTIVAKIGGVTVGSTVAAAASGRNYNLSCTGGTDGATVVFYIDGVQATPTGTYTAGGFNLINLYTYTTILGVTTGTATGIFSTAAVLAGTLTGLGSSPSVNVSFEYGLTTAYGSTTTAQSMGTTGGYTTGITGLTPSTTYHFRAKATDGSSTVYGSDATFTTLTPTLTVSTGSSTNITTSTATMTGSLTDLGPNSGVSVSFEYGTTTSYGSTTTPQSRTTTGDFSATISGLTAGTTYHYRAKAAGATTATGSDMTFTTSSASSGCTSGCCHWTWGTAYLNGTPLNSGTVAARVNGSQVATTTTNTSGGYNLYVPVTSGSTVTFTVGGATAAQSFTASCMGYNGSYNLYATTGTVAVSTGSSTYATATSAVLNGTLGSLGSDTSATVSFDYGLTTAYGSTTSTTSMSSTGAFTGGATGLTVGQTYHFRAKAVGSPSGTTVYGSDVTFTHGSAGSLAVSTGSGSYASSSTATLGGTLTSLGTDSSASVSFEYGTTTGYGSTTSTTVLSSTGAFSATATGLTAGQTYHFRAKAVGSPSGTTVYGSDVTYVHSPSGSLTITTTSPLPSGTLNSAYSTTLAATGGTGTGYSWTLNSGSLPTGLSLSAGGVISGTPTVSGTSSFNIRVTDSGANTTTKDFQLTVSATGSFTITTDATLPNGTVGVPYSLSLAATGGLAPYYYGVVSGVLPAGLSMPVSGIISGTPTTAVSSTITIWAYDSTTPVKNYTGKTFTLTINP